MKNIAKHLFPAAVTILALAACGSSPSESTDTITTSAPQTTTTTVQTTSAEILTTSAETLTTTAAPQIIIITVPVAPSAQTTVAVSQTTATPVQTTTAAPQTTTTAAPQTTTVQTTTAAAPTAPSAQFIPPSPPATAATDFISEDEAKKIALERAGLTEDGIDYIYAEFDRDDRRFEYDVEIRVGRTEYSVTVDAITGEVLEYEFDND